MILSSLSFPMFSSSEPPPSSLLAPVLAPELLSRDALSDPWTRPADDDGVLSKSLVPDEVLDGPGVAGARVVAVIIVDEGVVIFSFLDVGEGTAGAGTGTGATAGAGVVVVGACVVVGDGAGVVVGGAVVLHCVCPPSERIPCGHKVHAVSELPLPVHSEKP